MLDRAGKEKQNGGKAGETKCRRADWVVWLERVSPLSMIWVRRTHDYQRRAAESGSSGVQCSPIQLWVRGKEAGTFIKRKQKKKARRGRQPFEKSVVRVGWLNNQNEHEHMHQKASHWSQSAGYGFRERHKSDVCCNIRKEKKKQKKATRRRCITAPHERMTQGMGWSVSGGGGAYDTVPRYVIHQTTINTVTSRAKTGGSRHQTDGRTQLKKNTLEKLEVSATHTEEETSSKGSWEKYTLAQKKQKQKEKSNWKYNIYSTTIERWWVLGCALSWHSGAWLFYLRLIGFNRGHKKQTNPKNKIFIATCNQVSH